MASQTQFLFQVKSGTSVSSVRLSRITLVQLKRLLLLLEESLADGYLADQYCGKLQ
jgi:hypothetical protein